MARRANPPEPRSLADDLRGRTDASLAELLRLRPDLATPAPADLTALAARAATRASVQRALDRLEVSDLQVVEVVAALPEPAQDADAARLLGRSRPAARAALSALHERALLWGRPGQWRLIRTVRDVLGPYPAGLGPPLTEALDRRSPQRLADLASDLGLPGTGDPEQTVAAIAEHLGDPAVLERLLAQAPSGSAELLARLTWGPPVGEVADADRAVRTESATRPLDWLLAHGLLAVADPGHVLLPREVGLFLRGGRVHAEISTAPPPLTGPTYDPATVDRTAGSSAAEVVRLTGELLELWGRESPALLRAGGLAVRELKRTSQALEVDDRTAAALIEIAYAAGLLAADGEVAPAFAPTPAYDGWRTDDPAWQWSALVSAWLTTTRTPALVGSRDDRGATRNALAPDLDRPITRELRLAVLAELADAAARPGHSPDPTSLLDRIRWRRPRRRSVLLSDLVTATRSEAELLGVTGLGALSGPGRLLATIAGEGRSVTPDDGRALAEAIHPLLPEPVDHVLLQADLTAVAPGPLVPELNHLMSLSADVESRGGATVFRFSAASVRRALDVGWSAAELLRQLTAASRTPVPQPLTYLVEDIARRHGAIRVGGASAYLRSDDPVALDELMADRRLAALRARRLAPTVIAVQAEPATVLVELRALGLAPALESPDGALLLARPPARRTPPRQPPRPTVVDPPAPTPALLEAVVRSLREGERAADVEREHAGAQPGPRLGPTDPATALAALREAVAGRARVWIGYVDSDGRPVRRVVEPLAVDGGRVRAYDVAASEIRTFSVHRVTGVASVKDTVP